MKLCLLLFLAPLLALGQVSIGVSQLGQTSGAISSGGTGQTPALVAQTNFAATSPAVFQTWVAQTAGNFSVLSVRVGATSPTVTVSSALGNTYTFVISTNLTSDSDNEQLWYATNLVSGVDTITVTSTGNSLNCGQAEFSGVAVYLPVDQSVANRVASSVTADSGTTAATANAVDLVIGAVGATFSNSSISQGAGFTYLPNSAVSPVEGMEYLVTSSTGTQDAQFTLGVASESGTVCVAFKNHP